MGVGPHGAAPLGWWSPDPRGVLPLDGLRVSRVAAAFARAGSRSGWTARSTRWSPPAPIPGATGAGSRRRSPRPTRDLHRLGWAHSVECWREGRLAGGLYGLAIGGLFAGESMFHRETDASKVAVVALVELLVRDGDEPAGCSTCSGGPSTWRRLGVVDLPRVEYLRRLRGA